MSRDELDREYSPSSRAPGHAVTLRRYRELSDAARQHLHCVEDVPYGSVAAETAHIFPPAVPGSALQVFVHGGHWQESSKEDGCFAAPAFLRAGAGFVALGYGLAPQRSLDEMVASVRRGLRWVGAHAGEFGGRPDAVFASGSSAGAHLVAMALAGASDPPPIAGVALLSGVYDLEPLRHCYVNDAVGMTERTARANSPIGGLPLATPRVLVARGGGETNEYVRQHALFVQALRRAGQPCAELVAADRDHFTLPLDLAAPGTPLGCAVLDQMGLLSAR